WLTFHTIGQAAPFLPKAFADERFNFYGKTLSGVPELRPRWQRGVDHTSAALGEVVGKLYVQRHFPPETKAKVQAMVNGIVKAFGTRVDALTWMSPETKAKAKEKLNTLRVGVGYPIVGKIIPGSKLSKATRWAMRSEPSSSNIDGNSRNLIS